MTTFTDETLMAFADDELEPAARAAVDTALRDDPELQRRVARHRALRARIHLAYSAELQEAPPARLLAAARGAGKPAASITNLADARAASGAHEARPPGKPATWWPVASMAASLLLGLGLGYLTLRQRSAIQLNAGRLVAGGALADALSNRLGGDPAPNATARLGLSFTAKSGELCRVFILDGAVGDTGVACHHDKEWRVQVLAQQSEGGAVETGHLRTASSDLPPAVLDTVQRQIDGEALNSAAEAQARARGWQPVGH